jgi:hypothetical protein
MWAAKRDGLPKVAKNSKGMMFLNLFKSGDFRLRIASCGLRLRVDKQGVYLSSLSTHNPQLATRNSQQFKISLTL